MNIRAPTRAENTAAIVNGLLVLAIPLGLVILATFVDLGGRSHTSVTVRPEGASRLLPLLPVLAGMGKALLPFAVAAAWRTWVHAHRMLAGDGRGWQGVAEAGLCGFAAALLVLAPGIITRPLEAPPYLVVYGGLAAAVGICLGLLLRLSALLVLKVSGTSEA